MYSRRSFLNGMVALGAFGSVAPLPAWAGGEARLKMGVLSDVHLRCLPGRADCFRKALTYFRDRGADAVLIAGDIADSGRVAELKQCADTWYSVFPDDKAPDGRRVERLFVLGNHCVDAWRWGGPYKSPIQDEKERLADALGYGDNRRKAWRELFHEDFQPIWMKDVKGFTVIGAHWEKQGAGIQIEEFMKAHAKEIDPGRPFFYTQHEHPKDTCFGAWAWGHDDGRSTRALSAFPNAVAFSGHSHYTLTDERTVWQGAFTSCNTSSLFYFSLDYALRENAAGNRFGYTGEKRPRRMGFTPGVVSRQGQFLTVYDDCIVIERRDFASDLSLGDDFVLPLPLGKEKPYAYPPRSAARVTPEFPEGAKVEVAAKKDKQGADVYEVTFPHAETRGKCRVFEYEVTATLVEDEVDLVQAQRRVMAPEFCVADIRQNHRRGVCMFAAADLPLKGNYVFTVRPIECFGHKGAAIASALVRVEPPAEPPKKAEPKQPEPKKSKEEKS